MMILVSEVDDDDEPATITMMLMIAMITMIRTDIVHSWCFQLATTEAQLREMDLLLQDTTAEKESLETKVTYTIVHCVLISPSGYFKT